MAVELASAFTVLLDHRSVQFEPREHSARAGIAEHLGAHLPIGISSGVSPHRSGSHAGISSELEFAVEQVFHTAVVHDQHDQIDCLTAYLQAEAATLDGEEGRVAPTFSGTATGNSSPIARAKDEAGLKHRRNDRDALCGTHDFVRNSGVGGGLNLIQDI